MNVEEQFQDKRFTHPVRTRVTAKTYKKLQAIHSNSNCRSIGEVARQILSSEKILMSVRDASMDAPMEELASIRKELRSIGININQQTKYFHTAENDMQRTFYFMKTSALYKNVGDKVEILLAITSRLSLKWLRES